MSILIGDTTDQLYIEGGTTLTVGTGDFSLGAWCKITVDTDSSAGMFYYIADTTQGSPTNRIACRLENNAASGTGFMLQINGNDSGGQIGVVSTWYYVVVSRSGSTARCRVFDDSTSTTPVFNDTFSDSTNLTTLDSIGVGWSQSSIASANAEIESFKIHTGVAWSDAECRTESQSYSIVKSGGTDRFAWKLQTTTASIDGINEIGGSGPNFTNSGVTNGSSSPAQLSAVATLTQHSYRWLNDDGSESAATFAANLNTGISAAASTTKRLRVLLNATNDPATKQFKLQWKKSGGSWADVL